MVTLPHWLIGDAVALDELGNAVILEGNPHETISAHCGAQEKASKECLFCRIVCSVIQGVLGRIWPRLKTHCANSYAAERAMIKDSPPLP